MCAAGTHPRVLFPSVSVEAEAPVQCFVARGVVPAPAPIPCLWAGNSGPLAEAVEQSWVCALSPELSDQIQRALQLEEERKRAQEEAERLEADRVAALRAKEELERQAADQIKSQEQLVRAP